jgi:hypothetical protein
MTETKSNMAADAIGNLMHVGRGVGWAMAIESAAAACFVAVYLLFR